MQSRRNIQCIDDPECGYDEITLAMENTVEEAIWYLEEDRVNGKLFIYALLGKKDDFEKIYRNRL